MRYQSPFFEGECLLIKWFGRNLFHWKTKSLEFLPLSLPLSVSLSLKGHTNTHSEILSSQCSSSVTVGKGVLCTAKKSFLTVHNTPLVGPLTLHPPGWVRFVEHSNCRKHVFIPSTPWGQQKSSWIIACCYRPLSAGLDKVFLEQFERLASSTVRYKALFVGPGL